MYALVDCNNFYCSCERLFDPRLNNRPIIVLSNNDGCAVSRSEEAKRIGIAMGTPAFMIEKEIANHNIAVFSSNYTLYGDMSDRVMKTLAAFSSSMEIYSIDEAYLDMHDMPFTDLLKTGSRMRDTVRQNTGIPITVGIAPTKTLAKMANRYAKKTKRNTGVFWAANEKLVTEMLRHTEVGEICGIGPKYAVFLQRNGFRTAEDFARAPEEWVRVNMSVVGQRLLNEIRGIPAIASGPEVPVKKNICTSRSFGNLLYSKTDIAEALSNHAAACAFKLRQQRSCCRSLTVFIQTNPHKRELPQYARSLEIDLERASNNTPEIIKYVMGGFDMIFKEGFAYKKAGVIVAGLVPEQTVQQSVFDNSDNDRNQLVMRTLDAVNRSLGKESVRMAVQGFEKRYRLRAEHLSRKYTTNIDHVIKVRN